LNLASLLDSIALYAITHRSAPLDVIGKLEVLVDDVYVRLRDVVDGALVLATCNRFEVYVDTMNWSDVESILANVMGEAWGYVDKMRGLDAVRHLFRVASGLESQIVGEYEILGQVRRAWFKARANGYTSELLDKIAHRVLIAGRRARDETRISYGVVGYPQAGVELLSKALNGLDSKTIMIVGAGHAAETALKHLCSKYKPKEVIIVNRTIDKAVRVAELCENSVVAGLEDRYKFLHVVDGVFIAVSGGVKMFTSNDIVESKAVIVDISTPPVVDVVEDRTYTLDDVRRLSEESINLRLSEIPRVEAIIEDEIVKLQGDIVEFKAKVVISEIMRLASDLYEREIRRTLRNHRDGGALEPILRVTLNSYTKKILRPLILYMRDKARNGDSSVVEEIHSYFTRELGRGEGLG
jgi:glutamyl-tRNA reductase